MTIPETTPPLPWKESFTPELIRTAWPIAASMLSYSLMTVVDTLFVGQLGASTLAGVGLGGVLAFTLLCFGLGLLRSIKILISQARGAGKDHLASHYLAAGIASALGLGALVAILGQFLGPIVNLLAQTQQAGETGAQYLSIRSWGAPFALISIALREAQYGIGNSKGPMRAALLANLANIPLNAVLIFGLGWGAAGAAIATVISYSVEMGLQFTFLKSNKLKIYKKLEKSYLCKLWRMGLPLGVELFLDIGAFSLLAALIARMGDDQLAAHQIALQINHFAFLPAIAMGEAISMMSGQAVGANEDQLVYRVGRRGLFLISVYALGLGSLIALSANFIVLLFTPDSAVRITASFLLRLALLLNGVFGASVVARSVLRGAGDVRFPAFINIVLAWLCTPPITWLLGFRWGLGAAGGWIGLCVELFISAGILWWRLEGGFWAPAARKSRNQFAV